MKKKVIFNFETQNLSNEILIKVKSIFNALLPYLSHEKTTGIGADPELHMMEVNKKLSQYKRLEIYLYEDFFKVKEYRGDGF